MKRTSFFLFWCFISGSHADETIHLSDPNGGEITSPGYPGKYPNDLELKFFITAPEHHGVILTFHDFRTEDWDGNTKTDFVRIVDGKKSSNSRPKFFYGNPKTPFTLMSKSNSFRIRMKTNNKIAYQGFRATYKFLDKMKYCNMRTLEPTSVKIISCTEVVANFTERCSVLQRNYKAYVSCTMGKFITVKKILLDKKVRLCEDTNMVYCPYKLAEIIDYYDTHRLGNAGLTAKEITEEAASIVSIPEVGRAIRGRCQDYFCYRKRSSRKYTKPKKCGKMKKNKWRKFCMRCRYDNGCTAFGSYLG